MSFLSFGQIKTLQYIIVDEIGGFHGVRDTRRY